MGVVLMRSQAACTCAQASTRCCNPWYTTSP
ncbi:Uncharacterised protein [Bordetella pertussis]|nr:Uncharacterised protein [Bordetella pertussis]